MVKEIYINERGLISERLFETAFEVRDMAVKYMHEKIDERVDACNRYYSFRSNGKVYEVKNKGPYEAYAKTVPETIETIKMTIAPIRIVRAE